MSKFWRFQNRNENLTVEPKFGDDYIRDWVKRNGFKMKKEQLLEPVSGWNELLPPNELICRKDSSDRQLLSNFFETIIDVVL